MSIPPQLLDLERLPWDLRDKLMDYLPIELRHEMTTNNRVRDGVQEQIHRHLVALLTTIQTKLPLWVNRDSINHGPLLHRGEATLLFADITGFTPVTEALDHLGRIGNELLCALLNPFFSAMVAIVTKWGGDVLSFGGDAVLVLFTGSAHADYAVAAAWEMHQAMPNLPSIRLPGRATPHRLDIKIGIASGPLLRTVVGSPHRGVALALGEVLTTVDTMSHLLAGGITRLDDRTKVLTSATVHVVRDPQGIGWLPTSVVLPQTPVPDQPTNWYVLPLSALAAHVARLAPYLPHDLLDELAGIPTVKPGDGEQRFVVSMFVHLTGLHAFADRCTDDQWRTGEDFITQVFNRIIDVVERTGGTFARVDNYGAGHKLLILYGTPRARDADVEWAIRAALSLRDAVSQLNTEAAGRPSQPEATQAVEQLLDQHKYEDTFPTQSPIPTLKLRIGINAGAVVAGIVGANIRNEYTVIGDTVNTAARLMSLADARDGDILIGPEVYAALKNRPIVADYGYRDLRGRNAILVRAVQAMPQRVREQSTAQLVGRVRECTALQASTDAFLQGSPQVIVLSGEAGIGKSHLLAEIQRWFGKDVQQIVVVPPSRHLLSYAPFGDLVRQLLLLPKDTDPNQTREALDRALLALGMENDVAFRDALGVFIGVAPQTIPLSGISLEMQSQILAEHVRKLLALIAQPSPLALFLEDLHDYDPDSLRLLQHMLQAGWDEPVLVATTVRQQPDDTGQRTARLQQVFNAAAARFGTAYVHLKLGPLELEDRQALLHGLLQDLSSDAMANLLGQTGGNPLFLTLLGQRVAAHKLVHDPLDGTKDLSVPLTSIVPSNLHTLIDVQLSHLAPEVRALARMAAVLASAQRSFSRAVLMRIADDPSVVADRLEVLQREHIIEPDTNGQVWSFVFRHPLMQTVAYNRLQDRERRDLHRRIALALDNGRHIPDAATLLVLAYHYYESQMWDRALEYCLAAGQQARWSYDYRQAQRYLFRALKLAQRLNIPAKEVAAREGLGALFALTGHWWRARVLLVTTRDRAAALTHTASRLHILAECYRLLALVTERTATHQADYTQAIEWCDAGLACAFQLPQPALEVARLYAQRAEILKRQTEYAAAEHACEAGLAVLNALPHTLALHRERARLRWRKASIIGDQHHYLKAVAQLDQILLEIGNEDDALKAAILDNLAVFLERNGQLDRAEACYQECIIIQKHIGDIVGRMRTLNNLAGLHQSRGQYEQALKSFNDLQRTAERFNAGDLMARAHINIGIISFMRGHLSGDQEHLNDAAASIHRAQVLFRALNDRDGLVDCLYRLSEVALARGKLAEAYELGTQTRNLAREYCAPAFETCALRVMAEARLQQGQVSECATLLHNALIIQKQVGDPFDAILLLIARARYAFATGNEQRAQRWLQCGRKLAVQHTFVYLHNLVDKVYQQRDAFKYKLR